MAKQHNFPAKVLVSIANPTSALMFSVYAKDERVTNLKEIPVTGFSPFMLYSAEVTREWYNEHKKHSGIKIVFND